MEKKNNVKQLINNSQILFSNVGIIFWIYGVNKNINKLNFTSFYFNVAPGNFLIAYVAYICGSNSISFLLDSAVHPAHMPKQSALSHPLQPAHSPEQLRGKGPRGSRGDLLHDWDEER